MTSREIARLVYTARVRVDLDKECGDFRHWWERRHKPTLFDRPDLAPPRPVEPSEQRYARDCLRRRITWIKFCRAAKALSEAQFANYEQERLGVTLDRWADDGGVCPGAAS